MNTYILFIIPVYTNNKHKYKNHIESYKIAIKYWKELGGTVDHSIFYFNTILYGTEEIAMEFLLTFYNENFEIKLKPYEKTISNKLTDKK
jgi:hypothetical protein